MSVAILTLKEYRALLNDKRLDKYENLPVVYSKDDEGNGFDRILSAPGVMDGVDVDNDRGVHFKKCICIN